MKRAPSHQKKTRYLAVDQNFESLYRAVKEYAGEQGIAMAGLEPIKIPTKYQGITINKDSRDLVLGSFAYSSSNIDVIKESGTIDSLIESLNESIYK